MEPQKAGADGKISDSAAQQIQALLAEKESRTPAQQKLDSQLVYAIKFRRGDALAAAVPTLETGVAIDQQGKTVVDITARVGGSLIEDLAAAGAEVSYVYPQYNSLRATVPLDQLESIAAFPQVIFIMPKQEGQVWRTAEPSPAGSPTASGRVLAPDFAERATRVRTRLMAALSKVGQQPQQPNTGSVNSQGDTCHKANTARGTFGANGAGVRIGVLSNGCPSLAASQALGDLGPVTVLPGQVGTGDEGTAMLEIIHDLAPGAELFFATANPIISAFAQNIRDLRTAGCDIIVDDVFYFVETPFQDGQAPAVVSNTNGGLVIQAVKDVTAAGAMYFSSAGNQGNQDDGTSSCYQGDFVSGGTLALVPGGNLHDFDPTAGVQQFDLIQTGSGNPVNLYWSDPLGGSANDYDLFILNSTSTAVLASSTNVQSGTQDPFEQTAGTFNVTNNRLVVLQKTGAANRFFHITINANGVGKLGTSTEGTTKGHSMALDAYSCAATPALAPGPFPSPFSSANVSETFTSDGPRRIFFLENGTAITPGNFSSTGGTLRQKPDITAADKVSVTGVGGFPTTFSGTSAAAPHAGAIAGLLKSAFPNLTPAQIRTILISTAIDIEAAGVDRDTGAGIVMPFEAIQSNGGIASANLETSTITATELCCNSNTFIEPGESGTLSVGLINTGAANATGIMATLTTTTPNVNILIGTSAYPDLTAPSGTGTNTTLFQFMLGSTAPCDLKVNFVLTVTYTGGNSPKVAKFSVQTGRPPASVTTTIDAVAPPASADYTAITGTQTNRVTRDGRATTCNLPKSVCPGITAATNPRFDAYTFSTCSTGAASRCITVTLTTPCPTVGGGTQLFATAYTGSFVPSSICTNYLADAGVSPGTNTVFNSFTFTVAANATFVVVVSEVPGTATNCTYTLTVSGVCAACPTPAKVDNFTASGFNDGRVLLQWKSAHEVDNLGYNVYRDQNGQRTKVTPQLVGGSALMAGPETALTAGNSYVWADTPQGSLNSVKYWLEDIDLSGSSTWHGPVAIGYSPGKPDPALAQRQATLLTRLGFRQALVSNGLGSTPAENAAKLSQIQAALPFALAGGPATKLSVNREGWYRVTQQELVAAGLDSKVNPRFLQLFVDGREVPITVQGEQDGRFDPSDAVEFYGLGLDAASSDTRVYWLVAGSRPGARIEKLQAKGSLIASPSFPYTVERKDRTIYFSALRNGDAENFFGPVIASEAVDQSLTLQHIDKSSASSAQIEVALQGVTQQTHQVKVLLNGAEVGSVAFGGQTRGVARLPVSHTNLRDGDNVVRLIAQAGETDVSLLDSISITYQHTYSADGDALRFTATAGQQITIDGFTRGDVRVFDVTNPDALQEPAAVVKWQKGSYAVTASAPGAGQRTLLALTGARAAQVAEVRANQPSSWRQASNGADLLIITHRDFAGSLGNLKSLRQSQGLSVAVVDVEDVYDEFSYGDKTPQAVKDFLVYAKSNWKKAPRYLLLVGDASLDPKNYLGYGDSDYVPTKLIDTQNMETASDDWLTDFTGDGVEDLATGRLPVRTAQEAAAMINKIVSYDSAARSESILLVADRNDGYNFESSNSLLRGLIPAGLRVEEIDRGRLDDAAAKSMLIESINRGQKIVNYTGHGSVEIWRGNLLTNDDALSLTNARGLSLFVTMTCLNGYYQDPVLDSLAESLMKAAGGGAIAVWASSGMTEPGGQIVINQELYRTIFNSAPRTLGEATLKAKAVAASQDIRRTWVLFGDPTTKLR